MDELEAIEAELKECLQELDNGELLSAQNDGGADVKEPVNGMKTEICDGEGGRKREPTSVESDSAFQQEGSRESEKVLQWRAAFQKRVQEKDAEEEKAKAIWRKTAEKDLKEFYRRQADSMKKLADRKNDEANCTDSSRQYGGLGDVGTGNVWKRAAELCDFGTKAKSTKDVSRMRSVILALSAEPTPADAPPPPSASVRQ